MKLDQFDWPALGMYGCMSACMYFATGSNPTIEQVIATVGAQLLLLWIDVRSYQRGLEKGGAIVKEVWGIKP
jgi:hypothetical protein